VTGSVSLSRLLLLIVVVTACAKEKFHCLSVGNDQARECLPTAAICGKDPHGRPRSCFEQEQAFCFSKAAFMPQFAGERVVVCTPTRDECSKWSQGDFGDPSASKCVETSRSEVWQ
jgi:hypothetical protein